jgi:hypothetical protein
MKPLGPQTIFGVLPPAWRMIEMNHFPFEIAHQKSGALACAQTLVCQTR